MKPKVVTGPRGVAHVHYECKHTSHDPYEIESTVMIQCEMKPLRADGTAVQV